MKEKLESETYILLVTTVAYQRIKHPYYMFILYAMQINKADLFGCHTIFVWRGRNSGNSSSNSSDNSRKETF